MLSDEKEIIKNSNLKNQYYFLLLASFLPVSYFNTAFFSVYRVMFDLNDVTLSALLATIIIYVLINLYYYICLVIIKSSVNSFLIVVATYLLFINGEFFLNFCKKFLNYNLAIIANVCIYILLYCIIVYFISKKNNFRNLLSKILPIFTNVYCLITVVSAVHYFYENKTFPQANIQSTLDKENDISNAKNHDANTPDIYYIVPDMYANFENMKDYYDFDNKEFYDYLINNGFAVKTDSMSSYSNTHYTMFSLFNMNYVQNLISGKELKITSLYELYANSYANSDVIKVFKKHDFDIYINSHFQELFNDYRLIFSRTLQYSFLKSFMHVLFGEYNIINPNYYNVTSYKKSNQKLLDFINKDSEKPKFAFAHFTTPHDPFVFKSNGELRKESEGYKLRCCDDGVQKGIEFYLEQVEFMNKRLVNYIEQIKSNSKRPYIIIIQADHGAYFENYRKSTKYQKYLEKQGNLQAIYLSDGKYDAFNKTAVHVNIFRNIFNNYLGYNFKILEERFYYGNYANKPIKFKDVTDCIIKKDCNLDNKF